MDGKMRDIPKKVNSKQRKAIKNISDDSKISLGTEPTKVICFILSFFHFCLKSFFFFNVELKI